MVLSKMQMCLSIYECTAPCCVMIISLIETWTTDLLLAQICSPTSTSHKPCVAALQVQHGDLMLQSGSLLAPLLWANKQQV